MNAAKAEVEAAHEYLQQRRALLQVRNGQERPVDSPRELANLRLKEIELQRAETVLELFRLQAKRAHDRAKQAQQRAEQLEQRRNADPRPNRPATASTTTGGIEAAAEIIGEEAGEPIYNDKIRRFKFRLENIQVSLEKAEEFWVRYTGRRNNPKIIGVWNDTRANSLVIVGPPEAEQAIRDELAQWEADSFGTNTDREETLEDRQVSFERERTYLIEKMADAELKMIEADSKSGKAAQEETEELKGLLNSLADELKTVDRKLEVINAGIQRLNREPGGEY